MHMLVVVMVAVLLLMLLHRSKMAIVHNIKRWISLCVPVHVCDVCVCNIFFRLQAFRMVQIVLLWLLKYQVHEKLKILIYFCRNNKH